MSVSRLPSILPAFHWRPLQLRIDYGDAHGPFDQSRRPGCAPLLVNDALKRVVLLVIPCDLDVG